MINQNNPLTRNPLAMSLSKGHSWFDKLTTNGLYRHVSSDGLLGVKKFNNGFSLIELIVTVAIIGLLATLTLPLAESSVQHGKEQELRQALRQIREGLDAYRQAVDDGRIARQAGKSGYPASLQVLVDGMPDAENPISNSKIYFLRRIPRDPMATDPNQPNENTWGKRSYQSSADDPQEGEDVFDVYSLSPNTGSNGVPYRNW